MAEESSTRPSEDVERGEATPLLANQSEHQEEGEAVHWKNYPGRLWSQTTSYLNALRQSRTERGKQRQVDGDGREGTDSLHIPTEQRGSSRLQGLKADYPYLYWSLVGLLSLILAVFLLLLIALAHLYLITLRTPDDQLQSRIVDRSFSLDGPDEVKVLGVGSDGVTVSLAGRIGIDSDSALDEWLGERQTKGWYNRRERDVIEWAVGKVKGVQVDFGQVALRSPDWSVHRKIDKVHLIPDNSTDGDEKKISSLSMTSQEPTNLITFQLDPLYVPLPAIGSSARKTDGGPPANTLVNLTILLKPSGPDLLDFAKIALDAHKAVLDVNVQSVKVRGLNGKELRQESLSSFRHFSIPAFVDVSVGDTWRRLGQKLPKMDGNGTAGGDDFLNLTRYDFFEIGRDAVSAFAQRALGIKAYAEAKNPLGKLLKGHVEYSLPFGVYLPLEKGNTTAHGAGKDDEGKAEGVVLLAAVATEPFDIDGEDKIQLQLQGRVVPPPQPPSFGKRDQVAFSSSSINDGVSKSDAGADALSGFLSRFLRGEPNTVYVHGGSPFTEPSTSKKGDEENDGNEEPMPGGGSVLPAWLDKLLRTMKLPISFPGSKVTDLIQNVTINDLKITPHPFEKEKLLCSGTVMGVMNMPGQLATVDVEITDLWPDILVFNGKPPSMKHGGGGDEDEHKALGGSKRKDGDGGDDTPTPEPLPDPLPDHAFGRVTPHTWAPAKTYIDPEDPKRQRKLLYSELKDVPFTVLPGRGAEFRSFSWKVVTGEGARAGIEGKARAKIWNSGLGKLELSNLPVKGVFTVGKRGDGGNGDGDGDGDDGFSR